MPYSTSEGKDTKKSSDSGQPLQSPSDTFSCLASVEPLWLSPYAEVLQHYCEHLTHFNVTNLTPSVELPISSLAGIQISMRDMKSYKSSASIVAINRQH